MGERYYATPVACAFIGIFFPVIGLLSVAIRFYLRHARRSAMGWDDWLCIPGWLFNLAIGLGLVIGVFQHSIGYHSVAEDASDVDDGSYNQQEAAIVMYKLEWLLTSFCFLALGFMKLSVLFLYRRVFSHGISSGTRIFNILNWILIALVLLWTAIFSLSSFFMCGTHFSYAWSSWYLTKTHCLDILTQNIWGCIFDVVGDFFIILLPLPMVWRLHMPAANRVAIVATLLTGILSFICGIFRLYINVKYNDNVVVDSGKVEYVLGVSSLDVIAMSTILLFWTQVEVGVANVAICLPTMRPGRLLTSKRSREILEKIRLSWLSSSKGGSSASKNRRSYIHPEDAPTSKLGGYRDRGGDELKERTIVDAGTEGISKTVDFDVQTTAGYPLETETDAAPRYESLQYPPRTARKEYRPFELV